MSYQTLKVEIVGVAPLLMHNAQLADPTNKWVRSIKEITGKGKKKTESDLELLAKYEFLGGLYVDDKGRPAIPGETIEGAIRDGARKSRSGKDSQCGVISDGMWPLIYDGPKTGEELWEDPRFRDYRGVAVARARVMRMRPKFTDWSLKFEVMFEDEVVSSVSTLEKWLRDAGQFCGMMDFRPRFGRFEVMSIK